MFSSNLPAATTIFVQKPFSI